MFRLEPEQQETLLGLSRLALQHAFDEQPANALHTYRQENVSRLHGVLGEPHPCFVTLLTRGTRLRGCIGCVQTLRPLYENAFYFTLKAAFEDPRFPSVTPAEARELKIEISVLGPQEPLKDWNLVKIGTHGLCVRSADGHGLLLAKVAEQFRWNVPEFKKQTCIKAGLDPEQADTYQWFYFDEISFG